MKVKVGQALLLILLFFVYSIETAKQIDTFNVLLPQITVPNQGRPLQLITSEGACLDWTTTAPQIVKVTGISDNNSRCNRKALLQLTHVGPYPASIYVTAINGNTDEIINVPVRIRQLKKISIVTKSRMMNINERQDLALYAYDGDQNRFTSLQGLKFKWNLLDPNNVLQKISLKDSHLILPLQQRKNIESKGYQSDIIVIKGLIPGKVHIKVTCIEPGYQHLQDEIIISVHERFDIVPSLPSYILVDSYFQYSLATPSGIAISLPRTYYKATINSNFEVTNNLLVKSSKNQSNTTLKVEDIRTSPSYNSTVQIFAKQPDELKLIVDEYILVGEETSFTIQLYWNKKLLKGKSAITKIQTSLKLNAESMTVKSLKKQTTSITVSYKNLKVTKTIHSVLPIRGLIPDSKIHLPVDESYELKVIGGSGVYEFSSSSDHISVSNGGLVFAKKQGNTKIRVSDKKLNHYTEISVIVSQISTLSPLQYNKELNKNVAGPIFTSAINPVGAYTQCDDQHMLLQVSHYPHFQLESKVNFRNQLNSLQKRGSQNTLVKSVLAKLSLIKQGKVAYLKQFDKYVENGDISLQELNSIVNRMENYGICSVHVLKSYKQFQGYFQVYLKSNINIKNKFKTRIYKEIINQIQQGDKQYFIMTPLSSLEWKTSGGSYQWMTPTKVLLNNTEIKQKYPRISCPSEPKYIQMKIQYRNQESTDLLFPVSQSKNIKIDCKFPVSIRIKFQEKNMHDHQAYVTPGKTVRGHLYPLDAKLIEFYNSTNLIYKAQTQEGSATITGNYFSFQNPNRLKSRVTFSTLSIKNLAKEFSRIQDYFIWQPAQMFALNPAFQKSYMLTMFNPKQPYQFDLTHCSQHIETQCKQTISCALSQKQSKFLRVSTLKIGNGTLMIRDKWLYGMPEITAILQVVEANQMVLQSHRNSIQVSRTLQVRVWLYNFKRLIPIFQYPKSDIQLMHDAGLRIISQQGSKKNVYTVRGQKSGNYIIQAQQHSPKFLVSSNSIHLIVYDKVRFNIANLTEKYENQINTYTGQIVIPTNCMRRIKVSGGPPNIQIKFSQASHIKIHQMANKKNNQIEVQALWSGEGSIKIQILEPKQKIVLAILILAVQTAQIQKAAIFTLDQALIGAQFRMIPHLLINQRPIIDSQCDLKYQWSTSKQQGLQILDLVSHGGVNVTAIRQGDTSVQMKVFTKKKKVILTATKNIKVHQSLDIKFPTLIGQDSQKISSNMLIPPSSGYQFESHHSVTKISQCLQSLLMIDSNKIHTSRQKGIVSVKIRNNKDQSYNSFVNVIVTDIKGLFIQNFGSKINLQIGEQMKLNFYVMDMYGRQFYNNLMNIQYSVFSSNQDVLTAFISKNKQHIILQPRKIGTAKLLLRQGSQNELLPLSSISLLSTPHDIVEVEVGKILQPVSPIYVTKGGEVQFVYTGDYFQKWQVIEGAYNVRIEQKNSKVYAQNAGESIVSINGLSAVIRIAQISRVQPLNKISQIGALSQIQFQFLLFSTYKGSQFRVQSFNQEFNNVNNNIEIQCRTVYKNWFDVTTQIRQSSDGLGQEVNCIVTRGQVYPQDEKIPSHLILTVHVNKKILGSFEYPLHMMFMINKRDKSVLLSLNKPSHEIKIRTSERLQIDMIEQGQQKWYSSSFSQIGQVQSIKISIPTEQVTVNKHFKLGIYNTKTGQNQQIQVRYIASGEEYQQQEQSSQGWFSSYQWTDFIIVIMALVLLIIMLYEYMKGGNDKYKIL